MRKRESRRAAFALAALLALGASGCAENQIPELTQDEIQMVSEYVAVTMMKYEAGHRSRLVDLPEDELFPPVATAPPAPIPAPTAAPSEPDRQQPSDGTQPGGPAEVVNPYTMEEVMGLPEGVTVAFTGQQVCSRYPDNGELAGFSLDAVEGKKLLVLKFSLANNSAQEQAVNLLVSGASYRITVNGDYAKRALTTILGDNMSTFIGTLPVGSSAEAVLVIEVEDAVAENISSLDLSVKNESKTYEARLF